MDSFIHSTQKEMQMFLGRNIREYRSSLAWSLVALALLLAPALAAQQEIQPPQITSISTDRGLAAPQQELTLNVHLTPHNEAAYNKAVEDLYTAGSPTYHHWFTDADFAKYAPSASEVETVKKELESHGLSVISVGSNNHSVRVRGSVSAVESAFNTQIHNFEREGKTFYANATPAKLTGPAASLVGSVSGLSSFALKSMAKVQVNPKTGKPRPMIPLAKAQASGLGQFFTNNCFRNPAAFDLTTQGASLPVGQYYGNVYNQGALICGWTPSQVQTHYGLTSTIQGGLDGTGQTIVLVDGPSDPTVADDLVGFAQVTGLPAITSSNFEIVYPDGQPSQLTLTQITNWDTEADLDIQWAHAIAPGAKIILMITPTQDWTEFEFAIQYAVEHHLGNVISNSYGFPELAWGAFTLKGFDQVLQAAAASGVAVNFSSGDSGDEGTGAPNAGGASYPASSSYVTSVGGTSIGIPDGTGFHTETGWGNNGAYLSFGATSVLDPPESAGFFYGSGGGESIFIVKPTWQYHLGIPGANRQQPDISAFADPDTGAVFVSGGFLGVVGGTSLSSPVFSAIWALADQKAGKSLGQAAPLIAHLPAGAVKDIVPLGSATNVAGTVFDSNGAIFYSADSLAAPLFTTTTYYSSVWDLGGGFDVVLTFGTDSSLTVAKGWDNVTGFGVPNGAAFINAAAAAK
jgi:subtilase family serine protease